MRPTQTNRTPEWKPPYTGEELAELVELFSDMERAEDRRALLCFAEFLITVPPQSGSAVASDAK